MSRHPNADAVLALQRVSEDVNMLSGDLSLAADAKVRSVTAHIQQASRGSRHLSTLTTEIEAIGRQMAGDVADSIAAVVKGVDTEAAPVKRVLWTVPLRSPATGGHLRDYLPDGEPEPIPGAHYEATPLILPDHVDIGSPRQGKGFGDCYLIAALKSLCHTDPDVVLSMARQEGDQVIVTVGSAEYRMPATLPVDPTGVGIHATSPDGSTLVAYIEKAAAMHLGSYHDLVSGSPRGTLTWLTGDLYSPAKEELLADLSNEKLVDILQSGRPAVVVVPRSDERTKPYLVAYNLVANHTYAYQGLTTANDVILSNPWGRLDPSPLPFASFDWVKATLIWSESPISPSIPPSHDAQEED